MPGHEQDAREQELASWRRMSPAAKYRQLVAMVEMARRYKAARLRALHPDWSAEQVDEAVREVFLGASS